MTTYEYIKRIAVRKAEIKQQQATVSKNTATKQVDKKSEVSFVSLNERSSEKKSNTSTFLSNGDSKDAGHRSENGFSEQNSKAFPQSHVNQSYTSDQSETDQHHISTSMNNSNNIPSKLSSPEDHHLPHSVPDNMQDLGEVVRHLLRL